MDFVQYINKQGETFVWDSRVSYGNLKVEEFLKEEPSQ